LPLKAPNVDGLPELTGYLAWLSGEIAELIVVDGSPPSVYQTHGSAWIGFGLRHMAPSPGYACANGKVAGVLTGMAAASHDRLVIADDDVRYDREALQKIVSQLNEADVVRPQNYFEPLTWHARWDTARSLLNRAFDGDWPGTLGVRRSVLAATRGYDGDCLFENLELVRTVVAAGGREDLARDLYVRRLPPPTSHFLSQRVRQAYDEFARPLRLAAQLTLLPAVLLLSRHPSRLLLAGAVAMGVAEYGRRREDGAAFFPATSSLFAPLWLLERGVCSWLAVFERLRRGGVTYNGRVIRQAASSQAELKRRYAVAG
jgi:hypothetical protein